MKVISKPHSELTLEEVDEDTGCSVCLEDQRLISISNLKPVRVCKVLAGQIEWILNTAVARGFPITQIEGYRVGRTRGNVDEEGKRTKFSNHSFGIAVDINSNANGLYENCVEFGENCRLIRGGEWEPIENPNSIKAAGPLVRMMENSGFLWGGEIVGRQKDYMHFSPSGY